MVRAGPDVGGLVGAAVCPHPPLLIPAVAAGAAAELDGLRAACAAALAAGLAAGPARVVVVGAGLQTRSWPAATPGCLPGFGLAGAGRPGAGTAGAGDASDGADMGEGRVAESAEPLPLALTVGRWLLDRAGWAGPRELQAVAAGAGVAECVGIGESLAAGPPALLLVLGDGSARRSAAAPGYDDSRAGPFDACVTRALADADIEALLSLDEQLADELLVAGRPAWQVLAAAARASGLRWRGRLLHEAAPYGVGYVVASWTAAAESEASS